MPRSVASVPIAARCETGVAAPVLRSTRYSDARAWPAGFSAAYAMLPCGETSKPACASASTPSGPTVVSVPAFGGFWRTRTSRAVSMSYSVVSVAPGKLFV